MYPFYTIQSSQRMQTSHSGKIPLHKRNSVAPIISSNKAADCNFRKQRQVANRKIKVCIEKITLLD